MLLFENRVSLPVMPTFSRDITRGAAQKPFPKNISSQEFSRLDLTGLAECDSSTIFHRDRKELSVGLSNSTPLLFGYMEPSPIITELLRSVMLSSAATNQ
jgi:hypothetical protein